MDNTFVPVAFVCGAAFWFIVDMILTTIEERFFKSKKTNKKDVE